MKAKLISPISCECGKTHKAGVRVGLEFDDIEAALHAVCFDGQLELELPCGEWRTMEPDSIDEYSIPGIAECL